MHNKMIFFLWLVIYPLVSNGAGFDSSYKAYQGDFNADGRTDIYIRNTGNSVPIFMDPQLVFISRNGGPGEVASFLLVQNSDKSFSIQPNLSVSEVEALSQWPNAAVETSVGDFNLDDLLDIALLGLSTIVSGADDLLIFAPKLPGQTPQAITQMDGDFREFFSDTSGWIADKDYFRDRTSTVPVTTRQVLGLITQVTPNDLAECTALWGQSWPPFPCLSTPLVSASSWVPANVGQSCAEAVTRTYMLGGSNLPNLDATISFFCNPLQLSHILHQDKPHEAWPDYSVFNDNSRSMAAGLWPVLWDGELEAQTSAAIVIESSLEAVLGVEVMDGVLSSGGILSSEIDVPIPWLKYFRLNKLVEAVILVARISGSSPSEGPEVIFRVYGNLSPMVGRSWTPSNPLGVPDYRDKACLPVENSGIGMVTALLFDDSEVTKQEAEIIRSGCITPGLLEYVLPPSYTDPVDPDKIKILYNVPLNPAL